MTANTNPSGAAYNVVTNGFGFINRIREVAPKGAEPYLACDLALMEGVATDGDYSKVSCVRMSAIVKGGEARRLIRARFTGPDGRVDSPRESVVAAVSCGGLVPHLFTYQKGERAGEQGVSLRTSLLSITWMKIGDTVVDIESAETEGQDEARTPVAADGNTVATTGNAESRAEPEAASDEDPEFLPYQREIARDLKKLGRVELAKDHPEFEERRAYLKEIGLVWNRDLKAWARPAA